MKKSVKDNKDAGIDLRFHPALAPCWNRRFTFRVRNYIGEAIKIFQQLSLILKSRITMNHDVL